MKKLILTFAHLLILTSLFAQPLTQNTIWSLPPNYIEHTQFGPVSQPLPIPTDAFSPGSGFPNDPNDLSDGYDGQISEYSHNAMQDASGNILFFIVDDKVYNKDGYAFIDNQLAVEYRII